MFGSRIRVRVFDPFRVSSTHARLFGFVSSTRSRSHPLTDRVAVSQTRLSLTNSLVPHVLTLATHPVEFHLCIRSRSHVRPFRPHVLTAKISGISTHYWVALKNHKLSTSGILSNNTTNNSARNKPEMNDPPTTNAVVR